jgi:hypothetical protein
LDTQEDEEDEEEEQDVIYMAGSDQIKAATFDKLVEKLTAQDIGTLYCLYSCHFVFFKTNLHKLIEAADFTWIKCFLLTFRAWTTPISLLHKVLLMKCLLFLYLLLLRSSRLFFCS